MTTLGEFIRQHRAARHLSVRDLAKRASLSPAYVSDIELGRRHPSKESLVNISHALGVRTNELRACDGRPPLEDIKRIAVSDPLFSVALRSVIDMHVSGQQLLELLERRKGRKSGSR